MRAKKFIHDNEEIVMVPAGYGQYTLHAVLCGFNVEAHCTDSTVYDNVDNEGDSAKCNEARSIALQLLVDQLESK